MGLQLSMRKHADEKLPAEGGPSLRPSQGWIPRTHTSGAFAVAQLRQMRRNENAISETRRFRPHRTRPCTKRKDGAPSVVSPSAVQWVGHPPYSRSYPTVPSPPNHRNFHFDVAGATLSVLSARKNRGTDGAYPEYFLRVEEHECNVSSVPPVFVQSCPQSF